MIHTEVDTEIIASVLGGVRMTFGERWYGELACGSMNISPTGDLRIASPARAARSMTILPSAGMPRSVSGSDAVRLVT